MGSKEPRVTILEMREYIADTYGLPFVARMHPRQVAAIYNRMIEREKNKKEYEDSYEQMTLAQWILNTKGDIKWDKTT